MALPKIRKVTPDTPPALVVYGQHGHGKTSFAAQFPAPLFAFVQGERPPVGVEPDGMTIATYDDLMEAIGFLHDEEHEYQTFALDSLDKLEPIVWSETCRKNKWANIETPGYGKGYTAADEQWREIMDGCAALRASRGMTTILLAHSEVERFDDPTSVSYSRYDMRLHKRARAIIQDGVDGIFFIGQDASVKMEDQGFNKKRAVAGEASATFIHAQGKPSFNAKNRFGMPAKLPYAPGQGYAAVKRYLPFHG